VERKAVEIIEVRGGNKRKWPGGPWHHGLFHLLAEELMNYYAATLEVGPCTS